MEFPLLQWLAAVLFRWIGESDLVCRGVAIAFSLATVVALFGLGRCLWGRAVGRGAAFLYATSPSAISGRAFISDTPMVCFSAFGVWGFASYLRTGRRGALVWGVVTAVLACMVKVPAVIILAPIVYLAGRRSAGRCCEIVRPRRARHGGPVDSRVVRPCRRAVSPHGSRPGDLACVWRVFPDIMAVAGPARTVSHWATIGQLRDPAFYTTLAERLWCCTSPPSGPSWCCSGQSRSGRFRTGERSMCGSRRWGLFVLVSADGNLRHEFHQRPILLPAALYFGLAVQRAFDLTGCAGKRRSGWD